MDEQPDAQKRLTPNPEHLAKLKEGVEAWNAWRKKNPDIKPELQGADLGGAQLERADLRGADLRAAHLARAHLEGADLRGAHLEGADLVEADLGGAHLSTARLRGADLALTHLEGAHLGWANLQRASLLRADLREADLRFAEIQNAVFGYVRLGNTNFQLVRWRPDPGSLPDPDLYQGFDVRGVRHSDPLFDQFVRESEFIRACKQTWPKPIFWLWKLTCNCGRSIGRWLLTCGFVVLFFGGLFALTRVLGYSLVELEGRPATWLTDVYFSVVTFSTLGFGDVTPYRWLGELVGMLEVFLGYVFLGGAISIFAAKFLPAR